MSEQSRPLACTLAELLQEMGIELFGAAAVGCMALFYALEERSPSFILLFAVACLAASSYAVLIRTWPFAVIEFLWAGLALRRWMGATATRRRTS